MDAGLLVCHRESSGPFDPVPVGSNAADVNLPRLDPSVAPGVVGDLLRWAVTVERDLPWRASRDPWEVLVSEVMSQQTQIERVVPKWLEFVERFPNPASLSMAPVGDVIGLWVGLGYNRRARMLHECASAIVERHGGDVPESLADLLGLPGIGPYTARAVLAFAFEHDVGVVDTNVGRVLARLGGETLGGAAAQDFADQLVPAGQGWEWNRAVLDFGASVCTKATPSCGQCPLREDCAWRGVGDDPAVGSAGVSTPQSKFAGSDREGRGRLVRALAQGPLSVDALAATVGWPDDVVRAERILVSLERDKMVVRDGEMLRLP